MSELLSAEEIWSRFPEEWVLLDDLETDAGLKVQAARVLHHSKDRVEIWRKAQEAPSKRIAVSCIFSCVPLEPPRRIKCSLCVSR